MGLWQQRSVVHWEQFMTILNCLKLSQTSADPYQIFNILNPS